MAFWLLAAGMMLLAILIIVLPIMRSAERSRDGAAQANIAIYRRRLRELEEELAAGSISQQHHDEARAEIDRQLLDDVDDETVGRAGNARGVRGRLQFALVATLLVPAVVAGLYTWTGWPDLSLGRPSPSILQASAQSQMEFVKQQLPILEARLREKPDDGDGWFILGRAYMLVARYQDAANAFKKAQDVLGVSAPLLAERAQALARAAGGRFDGQPAQLIARALKLDPGNTLALWLSGIAAQQGNDRALAIERWRAALATVPDGSEAATTIQAALAQIGSPVKPLETGAAASKGEGGVRIEVSVRLDPKFAREFAADTPVFVFARAVDGPRMPLAVVRTTVGHLPQTLTLDDSKSMGGGMKLSSFPEVQVVARVSPDGQATPRPGNVQGSSGPIRTDTDRPVTLIMNSRI